jgi:hypothetical protein
MALIDDGIEALKALLSCVHSDGYFATHAYIEEKNEAKLKKLCLSELTPGMLLLATDKGRNFDNEGRKLGRYACMSPLFKQDGKFDQNRSCDAVLIRKVSAGCELFYIELKSDNPSGFAGQFKSTQAFMGYVLYLVDLFCNIKLEIKRERYIVFHTDSQNATHRGKKQKTRFSPKDANTAESPMKFCVRNNDTIRCTEFF